MSTSKLFVSRFAVFKSSRFVYDETFHRGVNIIRGENGTGKSTIMDLLSYALGSVITEWTQEQLSCDWVMAEVEINGRFYCLKRDIVESGQSRMDIFEGIFDEATNLNSQWTQYSIRRSEERHSFSQQIFELLGLPRHKTDDAKNLTLHQILRLIYVDQLSQTTKLLKEDKEFDNATYRRAIGDYLLGIDDLEAHNLRQDLLAANKKFEKLNGELNAIYRLFGGKATNFNEQALNNEIAEIIKQIEALRARQDSISRSHPETLDELVLSKANELQDEIDLLTSEKHELESTKSETTIELVETELFLNSLLNRKESLEQSRIASGSIGAIEFKYCPACLEPIKHHNHSACPLCKSEERSRETNPAYIKMLNELNFQIRESQIIIRDFRDQLDKINVKLPPINHRIKEAKLEYQQLEIATESKNAILTEIASEIGFCSSQILALEERREHISKIESARTEKEEANTLINQLQEKLDQVNASQASRYNTVYDSIEKIASTILAKDGGYEPTFDQVEEVTFDFAKDKMFVNGRSKFSASSMVVMKNSIRLAIFLHSVEDKKARLPNLLIMDNIEDKGMVHERSQNFQRVIISECSKLNEEYQLIFTTSMIDPVLNRSNYCIGPMYEKGTHTLKFQ